MTIHVNIGEAKTRLSELVAAVLRGEEVIIDRAGTPQVRLVAAVDNAEAIAAKRRSAFGMYAHLVDGRTIDVRSLKMTNDELDARERRKLGWALHAGSWR